MSQKEVVRLNKSGFEYDFIKKTISSDLLPEDKVTEIVKKQLDYSKKDIADKKVDSDTIQKCFGAGVIATLVSGTGLGLVFMYTSAVSPLLLLGVMLLCYAIVNGIVKKSKNNSAVSITTAVASCIAIALGRILFSCFGPQL